jgi:hypothetical protein
MFKIIKNIFAIYQKRVYNSLSGGYMTQYGIHRLKLKMTRNADFSLDAPVAFYITVS